VGCVVQGRGDTLKVFRILYRPSVDSCGVQKRGDTLLGISPSRSVMAQLVKRRISWGSILTRILSPTFPLAISL
jgi:hypothetical protein